MVGRAFIAVGIAAVLAGMALPAHAQRDSGTTHSRAAAAQKEQSKYDFELPYVGKPGKLSFKELADSGKPFVVFIWLTDCELCHLQLPYVDLINASLEEQLVHAGHLHKHGPLLVGGQGGDGIPHLDGFA